MHVFRKITHFFKSLKCMREIAYNEQNEFGLFFSDSKLTQLLQDELGGNCKTRAVLNIKPQSDPSTFNAIVLFTTRLSQVKNFPVINDSYAQVCSASRSKPDITVLVSTRYHCPGLNQISLSGSKPDITVRV